MQIIIHSEIETLGSLFFIFKESLSTYAFILHKLLLHLQSKLFKRTYGKELVKQIYLVCRNDS